LPSKPDRERWHDPNVWAPDRMTISLSSKPIR
jgi:hypothetical protein